MATARRSGTNEGVATYGGASRDFQEGEMSDWEGFTDVDLTTGIEKVAVSNVTGTDRFITGELLDFSSSGATATFYGISRDDATMYYLVLTGTISILSPFGQATSASLKLFIAAGLLSSIPMTTREHPDAFLANLTPAIIISAHSSIIR